MKNYLVKFFYVLPSNKSCLIPLLLLFLFTPLLDTVSIGLIGPFTSLATKPESIHQSSRLSQIYHLSGTDSIQSFILILGLFAAILFYVKLILSWCIQRYIYKFSYHQLKKLRLRLMNAYLSAPFTFYLKANTANLLHNSFHEVNNFCNDIMISLLKLISEFFIIIFIVILLAYTDAIATATITILLLLALLFYNQFRKKLVYFGREASQSRASAIRVLNHALGGFKETRIIGCENYFQEQMDEQAQRYSYVISSYNTLQLLPRLLMEGIFITFIIGFTSLFILLNDSENLTSVLSIFVVASIRLIPSFSQFMTVMGKLRNSSYTLNRLYLELKEIEQLCASNHSFLSKSNSLSASNLANNQAMHFARQIVLDQVTYRYPGTDTPALHEISLSLKKGKSIAFIGKSGSGKTTLADVILGLLMPESGDIRVDDQSIYVNLRSWQNLVGYIPQSIFLIDDTLERNIAFGVPDHLIDPKRLDNSIKAAQLEELVKQLPDGIKTTLGERGVRLSGGQRQRVGIARTLYHEREILVMDEATSALDSETETLVTEAIKSLSGTKTMIIIAHRLSTIEHCDWVYVLEQGRIVKSGAYQDVVVEEQMLHGSDSHSA
jgi:ATP-binding cassette, subfamily B, bacterial PglK